MKIKIAVLLLNLLFFTNITAEAAILPISWGPVHKSKIEAKVNHFPSINAMNLEGEKMTIPKDLAGKFQILLVAFKRKQQKDIDTWLSALSTYVRANKELQIYELPTLKKFGPIMRFNINNGMRYGIASKDARSRTVTLYLEKQNFNKSLNISTEEQIHTFLINEQGLILWKASGRADNRKVAELKHAVERSLN